MAAWAGRNRVDARTRRRSFCSFLIVLSPVDGAEQDVRVTYSGVAVKLSGSRREVSEAGGWWERKRSRESVREGGRGKKEGRKVVEWFTRWE